MSPLLPSIKGLILKPFVKMRVFHINHVILLMGQLKFVFFYEKG